MRIVTARLDYISDYNDDPEKKRTSEAVKMEKRKERLKKVGIQIADDEDCRHPTIMGTESQIVELMMLGESLSIKASTSIAEDKVIRAADALEEVAKKLERFADGILPEPSMSDGYNSRVEVYTPGAGLMLFNRVLLLQDTCSDALQAELDNGWRIIAACPQPDQRRPDYILGRYDPKYADNESGARNSALRG